jgi:hypothetical protein
MSLKQLLEHHGMSRAARWYIRIKTERSDQFATGIIDRGFVAVAAFAAVEVGAEKRMAEGCLCQILGSQS